MPKLIDPIERKQLIAQATWKIMLEQGRESASVRKIAKEAGLSLGAMRYYFSTQEELMLYAEALVYERLTDAAASIFQEELPPLEKIINVLLTFLPTDSELETEAKVRLIFKVRAHHKQAAYNEQQDGALQAIKNIMSNLILLNMLKKDLNVPYETDRLIYLLDGMVLDAMVRPDQTSRERQQEMVIYHLNSICKEDINL
ncbi:TetR/AcrR family transcriptional regulator [Planococcus wigleyi]|uniref:TetR family transcriptional regulator C-terminal domain-containing protein n=1 Tax=Planococcus wigleyi TaxID=2762216 RepID=A0ABR8WEF7_9BACL|nr:TetR family transcriptional regulator C-terminal domain-containing protein [Planococcus wigleyi]MBD8015421.1 TetR family transcriptional regulator C-terminal domain-containing protein [Planococcus wigleyi]